MKTKIIVALIASFAFGSLAHAENFYVDCNLKGMERMSEEQRSRVFWNRHTDTGKGNGGEAIDVLFDLSTGDQTITCVKTEDEDTRGNLYVLVPGVPEPIFLGPLADPYGEIDPGSNPLAE
jgi:hypothetical protein|tara:strand:+ start:106 stop:468 length:363 start_codon:yes stop_codon:yes gene_type:complete